MFILVELFHVQSESYCRFKRFTTIITSDSIITFCKFGMDEGNVSFEVRFLVEHFVAGLASFLPFSSSMSASKMKCQVCGAGEKLVAFLARMRFQTLVNNPYMSG